MRYSVYEWFTVLIVSCFHRTGQSVFVVTRTASTAPRLVASGRAREPKVLCSLLRSSVAETTRTPSTRSMVGIFIMIIIQLFNDPHHHDDHNDNDRQPTYY